MNRLIERTGSWLTERVTRNNTRERIIVGVSAATLAIFCASGLRDNNHAVRAHAAADVLEAFGQNEASAVYESNADDWEHRLIFDITAGALALGSLVNISARRMRDDKRDLKSQIDGHTNMINSLQRRQ